MTDEVEDIGGRIKVAREAAGMTRKQLADAAGINAHYLYQFESGRRVATLETLWAVAVSLGIDPNTLDHRLAKVRPKGPSKG